MTTMGRLQEAKISLTALILIVLCCNIQGEEISSEVKSERESKLSVFQVVKFSNSICSGSSRRATSMTYICYGMCTSIVGSAIAIAGTPVILQPSFGLSLSPDDGSQS